jgi:FlaA1/EpsC-like NDP-sugar epimerase
MRRAVDPTLVLFIADVAVAWSVFLLAVLLRFRFDSAAALDSLGALWPRALVFSFWIIVGMLSVGMYRQRQRPRLWELVARVVVAVMLATMANVVFFYLIPQVAIGRGVLGVSVALTAIALSISRWQILRLVDFNPVKQRILVLGAGRSASKVGMLRRRADRRRFDVVGYVPSSEGEAQEARNLGLEPLLSLADGLAAEQLDRIVVALDERRGTFPVQQLLEKKFSGVPVMEVVEFLERETEKIDLDVLRPGWLLFASSSHSSIVFAVSKRSFDLIISFALLAITSPLFLLVWLGILVEDGPKAA